MPMARWYATIVTALALLLVEVPARADAIDGDWCHKDGRRVSIDGPTIVTAGGKPMEGDYRRHQFYYTIPAGELDAGAKVAMEQLDEDNIVVFMGAGPETKAKGPGQPWHRCKHQPMT